MSTYDETVMAADTKKHPKKRSWEALDPPLSKWILEAVQSMGFKQTTPVQASTIPLFMAHKDVVVEAVTGSGKTLAFLIPIIERILRMKGRTKKHHVASIIISPTRELAVQIHSVLLSILAFHAPSAAQIRPDEQTGNMESPEDKTEVSFSAPVISPQLVVGGQSTPTEDLSYFLKRYPNVLIATPGRLLEILSSSHVHCPQSSFEMLVLDEADRLLDMGFKDDLQKIMARLPKQRRTGLFSASVSEALDQIVRVGLRNPVKISVKVKGSSGSEDQKTPASLQMHHIVAKASHRFSAISQLLSNLQPHPNKTIIYLSTCAGVDYFQHLLPSVLPNDRGLQFKLIPLHGKHPPKVRQKNFKLFSESITPSILLTTDVAARGLDVPQVDLVLQVDPPSDPKVFLHRCGRAGRAGRKGLSVLFLQPGHEEEYIHFLEIRKTPVTPLLEPMVTVSPTDASTVAEKMRAVVLTDRSLHDKAQRGFVSWLKAYSKHQASSIFRVSDIDWEDQAQAWALLKLPKMPELRKWNDGKSLDIGAGKDLKWSTFAYRDKKREEARLRAMREAERNQPDVDTGLPLRQKNSASKRPAPTAWSNTVERKEEREVRRDTKRRKREYDKWEKMSPAERREREELLEMIEQVKRGHVEDRNDEEFEGFDA